MINVNEIRIGNYYKYPNSKPFIVELKDMGDGSFLFEDADIIEEVPLCEEILLDLGFIKREDGCYQFPQITGVEMVVNKDFCNILIDGICFALCDHLSVHKIQNIVNALFNENLKPLHDNANEL